VAERVPVTVDVAVWNEYTIIAKGNHLVHKVNGKVTIDLVDHVENAHALEGLIAFQIHRGPAMTVQIKDVILKELPGGGAIPFAKSNIPNDAQLIEKPAPRGPKGKDKGQAAPAGKGPAQAAKPAAKKPSRPNLRQSAVGQNNARRKMGRASPLAAACGAGFSLFPFNSGRFGNLSIPPGLQSPGKLPPSSPPGGTVKHPAQELAIVTVSI
jgi:hypothetical protein